MTKASVRCFVSGKVQGVWFRDSTRRMAESLGITGSAVNLSDGRVEVVAYGKPEDIARLKEWLKQGPPGARVEKVECETLPATPITGFVIG